MRSILSLLFLAASAGAASACETPVISIGANGQPEYISPERDLTSEMETFFGPPPAPGSILVIDARARTGWWLPPDSGFGPVDVGLLFGADDSNGFLYSGPDECTPRDLPMDPNFRPQTPAGPEDLFDTADSGKKPEDLFPDEASLGLQPRSGLWQARLGETRLQGCPAMVAQAFPQSPGALPAKWLVPRPLNFKRPFHPDQLEMSRALAGEGMGQVNWTSAGAKTWQAEVMPQIFGQIPAGQGAGSRMIWTLAVQGPDRIDHSVVLDIVFPAEAAQVMGSKGCKFITDNHWVRVGD